jgi:hypothetical protein
MCTDLVQADDLTVGLLDLPQTGEEVPETALSNNRVGRKNAHTVELGSGLGVSGQMTPNDLVFLQATCWATESALSDGQNVRRHMFVLQLRDHHDSVERIRDALMLLFKSCSRFSSSFSPLRKVGAGARSLQFRCGKNAYPSAQKVSIQLRRSILTGILTVMFVGGVGSR